MPLIAILIASYSLAVHAELERAIAGLVLLTVANAVAVTSQDQGLGNFAFGLIFIVGAWAIGRVVRARPVRIEELEVAAERRSADASRASSTT